MGTDSSLERSDEPRIDDRRLRALALDLVGRPPFAVERARWRREPAARVTAELLAAELPLLALCDHHDIDIETLTAWLDDPGVQSRLAALERAAFASAPPRPASPRQPASASL